MIKKYKFGDFVIEIRTEAVLQEVLPSSQFLYEGEQTDYRITVEFTSELPRKIENPDYTSDGKLCVLKNSERHYFYKSRDNSDGFYACRIVGENENSIRVLIDEKYREMLWAGVIFSLIGIEELVAERNGCLIHASFIEKDGEAILFTGPCSIGKSTQANLWREYADAVVVNGDKALIFEKDGIFYAAGLPYSGSSKDCLNRILPIKTIVCLKQAPYNTAVRIAMPETFFKLYKNCYPVPCSRELTNRQIDFVQKLSLTVPVYEYACLPDESAVRFLERELCRMLQNP